jgi:medium-chain acyl-[acyl-carrier-protein] hydrolase
VNRIKLFCLPFAGGSAAMFNPWPKYLDAQIEVIPMEFAGRGKRILEPLDFSLAHIVEDALASWRREVRDGPYAFFGHSLGAMVVYELAVVIKQLNFPPPEHIFFSGRPAPGSPRRDSKLRHLLPDAEFKAELLELGGTANEVFEHPELMELVFPVLRNDFRIAEEYHYRKKVDSLDCDITILLGREEDVLPDEAEAWIRHTRKNCVICYFPGGHFFIQDQIESIARLIDETLLPIGGRTAGLPLREVRPGASHDSEPPVHPCHRSR